MKLVGLVKYLLNEFAMSLLEVMVWLLNLIEWLGFEEVGSLLFNDLMVFQEVFWFCLWFQGVLM